MRLMPPIAPFDTKPLNQHKKTPLILYANPDLFLFNTYTFVLKIPAAFFVFLRSCHKIDTATQNLLALAKVLFIFHFKI